MQKVVNQIIKILKYDYKFFAEYIGEMMSIFYETAYALLNADVANVLGDKLSLDTIGERVQAALSRYNMYREALGELSNTSIPRRMFREPWFKKAGVELAYGFFESGEAGCSLDHFAPREAGQ